MWGHLAVLAGILVTAVVPGGLTAAEPVSGSIWMAAALAAIGGTAFLSPGPGWLAGVDAVLWVALVTGTGGPDSPYLPLHVALVLWSRVVLPGTAAVILGGFSLLAVLGVAVFEGRPLAYGLTPVLVVGGVSTLVALAVARFQEGRRHQQRVQRARTRAGEQAIINEERVRLAREIHDGLGGSLSTLILQSEFILRRVDDGELASEVAELKQQAEEAIDELRRSLTMMRRDFDLHRGLSEHLERFGERVGIEVELKFAGRRRRLPSEMQLSLFRALQECLTNIQKHAEAETVKVRVTYDGDFVSLRVEDDGVGFDAAKPKPGHYGLTNLEERARRFRGTMELDAKPGQGTRVLLTLAIPAEGSHIALDPLLTAEDGASQAQLRMDSEGVRG